MPPFQRTPHRLAPRSPPRTGGGLSPTAVLGALPFGYSFNRYFSNYHYSSLPYSPFYPSSWLYSFGTPPARLCRRRMQTRTPVGWMGSASPMRDGSCTRG